MSPTGREKGKEKKILHISSPLNWEEKGGKGRGRSRPIPSDWRGKGRGGEKSGNSIHTTEEKGEKGTEKGGELRKIR